MEHNMLYFYRNAILKDLCYEYKLEWKKKMDDLEEMLKLSLRQQSIPFFATATYEGWGLSVEYLEKTFKDYINSEYTAYDCDGSGVENIGSALYVNHPFEVIVSPDVYVYHFMDCNCCIKVPQTKCPTFYLSNKCNIDLKLFGFSSIRVYLFDKSEINISDVPSNCNIIIYKYSPDCKVCYERSPNIHIFSKELKL